MGDALAVKSPSAVPCPEGGRGPLLAVSPPEDGCLAGAKGKGSAGLGAAGTGGVDWPPLPPPVLSVGARTHRGSGVDDVQVHEKGGRGAKETGLCALLRLFGLLLADA